MAVTRPDGPAAARLFLERRRRPRWPEAAFWLAAIAVYFAFPGYLVLGAQVLIAGLFALSLDLILGLGGIVSLGHAAFFGMGAYAAGLLAQHGWGEPLTGLAAAAAAAGLSGLATSFVVVRLRGAALLVATMGIGLLLHEAALRARGVTGGEDGLQGISMAPLLGLFSFDLQGRTAYAYALCVLFLCFLLARRLAHSPFGLSLAGIRENARRMPAIGADIRRHGALVYTLSAAMAGVAGGLLAQTTEFVSAEVFSFQRSAEVLVTLTLGGAGYLYGGLIGAAVLNIARDFLSGMDPRYWFFWLGLMLVALVLFAPGGIRGIPGALARRLGRGGKARP
jgi:branched-chain amino acid transport system permease protein